MPTHNEYREAAAVLKAVECSVELTPGCILSAGAPRLGCLPQLISWEKDSFRATEIPRHRASPAERAALEAVEAALAAWKAAGDALMPDLKALATGVYSSYRPMQEVQP